MKTCSMNDFINELKPWLDTAYIRAARVNEEGRFEIFFTDGTRNVYLIDDCSRSQAEAILKDLKGMGITVDL